MCIVLVCKRSQWSNSHKRVLYLQARLVIEMGKNRRKIIREHTRTVTGSPLTFSFPAHPSCCIAGVQRSKASSLLHCFFFEAFFSGGMCHSSAEDIFDLGFLSLPPPVFWPFPDFPASAFVTTCSPSSSSSTSSSSSSSSSSEELSSSFALHLPSVLYLLSVKASDIHYI